MASLRLGCNTITVPGRANVPIPAEKPTMRRLQLLALLSVILSLSATSFAQEKRSATPAEQLKVAAGFKVELLKSATDREGSWVSMAVDAKGRLYISPQQPAPEGGLMRVTLD